MKKVVVVDDEKAGRQLIAEYLAFHPDLITVGEANNGVDAIRTINEFRPDLVFLDIQMPGMTGFEVLQHLQELPRIIFSTAYDQYALKAFEVHAVDYLLKPYTRERFDAAVARVEAPETPRVAPLADSLLMTTRDYPERVLVERNKKFVTLAVADIYHISAYGDYSRIHTASETYLSSHGISGLEEKLNPAEFLRVHRSNMVNLGAVREISRFGKTYMVTLRNGEQVRVSRGYADKIKDLMV